MEIKTTTGQEWHTSYGAKGYVFVVDGATETHIYQSKKARLLSQEWEEVGNKGRHGKWCEADYEVQDGTIIKLFSISTRGGHPNGGGAAYFVADANAPEITATGDDYAGRSGSVSGHLRRLELAEVEAWGSDTHPTGVIAFTG